MKLQSWEISLRKAPGTRLVRFLIQPQPRYIHADPIEQMLDKGLRDLNWRMDRRSMQA